MATLHSITMPDGSSNDDDPIYLVRLALGPTDLRDFSGLWSMAESHRVLKKAVEQSRAALNYTMVIKYHLLYHEWIGPDEMIIREADLEVYVT